MKRISLLSALFISTALFMASCGGSTEVTEPVVETVVEEEVVVEEAPVAMTANLENGEAVYNKMCMACHTAGVAGAAKLDDKARWEESAAKGLEVINSNIINGFTGNYGVMPPKGGNPDFTDEDVKDAAAYMMGVAGVVAQ